MKTRRADPFLVEKFLRDFDRFIQKEETTMQDAYPLLPAALRGNALESREGFPIVWEAPSPQEASLAGLRVQETVLRGGLDDRFLIHVSGTTVTVTRT